MAGTEATFTVQQAAEALGVSVRTIRRRLADGELLEDPEGNIPTARGGGPRLGGGGAVDGST